MFALLAPLTSRSIAGIFLRKEGPHVSSTEAYHSEKKIAPTDRSFFQPACFFFRPHLSRRSGSVTPTSSWPVHQTGHIPRPSVGDVSGRHLADVLFHKAAPRDAIIESLCVGTNKPTWRYASFFAELSPGRHSEGVRLPPQGRLRPSLNTRASVPLRRPGIRTSTTTDSLPNGGKAPSSC